MPTRYLRPGIRDSETMESLSPMTEVFFYRLLVTVDDYGRYDARPAMLKAACFPIKDAITAQDCAGMLDELARAGLVLVYASGGKPYLQMQKWENKARSQASKYPPFDGGCVNLCDPCADDAPPVCETCEDAQEDVCNPRTTVCNPRPSLPGTGTGTGTENREPEPKTEQARSRQEFDPLAVELPDGLPEHEWHAWIAYRRHRRLTCTALTITRQLDALREWQAKGHDPTEIINTAIRSGWQGLFEPKAVKPPTPEPVRRSAERVFQ